MNINSIVMWVVLPDTGSWDCFKTPICAGGLEDSKSTSGGTLCAFGSHTFVPISWMCKKQTGVSHSSTESEIISLDNGLRLDGLLALDLWDLIVSVLGNVSRVSDGSGQLDVVMGQSILLSETKAEVPLENDIPSHQNLLLQRHEERIKLLSQENKVSKFCMEAGFVHVVEIGQYFITKDTGDFGEFRSVACREYTLHRDDESSQPKGWIQGNTRIRPVLEITTSYLYGKHGIEVRIWSLSQDNSHSWVRISHGSNKYVVCSNCNNTEVLADLPEEQA